MPNNENHHTIRIRTETYRRLKVVAAQMGRTIVSLIDEWVTDAEIQHKRADKRARKNQSSVSPQQDAE